MFSSKPDQQRSHQMLHPRNFDPSGEHTGPHLSKAFISPQKTPKRKTDVQKKDLFERDRQGKIIQPNIIQYQQKYVQPNVEMLAAQKAGNGVTPKGSASKILAATKQPSKSSHNSLNVARSYATEHGSNTVKRTKKMQVDHNII